MLSVGFMLWNMKEIALMIKVRGSCQNMQILVRLVHDEMVCRLSFILVVFICMLNRIIV